MGHHLKKNFFLLAFCRLFKIPYLYHIPGPRGLEFVKLMFHFQRDSLSALEETYKRFGKVASYPWPVSTIIIYDPKIIKQVLIDKNQIYIKGTQTEKMKVVLGEGLVTNNDRSSWLKNRVIVSKETGTRAVRHFSVIISHFSEELIAGWNSQIGGKQKAVIDISISMRNITFNVAGKTLLGAHLTSVDAEEVDAAVLYTSKMAHDHMFQFFPTPYWIPTEANVIFHKHCQNLDRIVYRLIKEARDNEGQAGQSILERLVLARDPETNKPLDEKTLRDEVLTLLIAGYETTSNTLTWILGLIATHPDIQGLIQEELDHENALIDSMEFTKKYPFLYYTILEGIRLYTTIPMSSRKTTAQDFYEGYEIPSNTSIVIPAWVIHRHQDFWNDPLKFNPLRFKDIDVNTLDNYIPFSKGGRRCVGEAFATVEVAIIISSILRQFNVYSKEEKLPKAVAHVSLKPEKPMELILERRV